jgi:hypothetical protein
MITAWAWRTSTRAIRSALGVTERAKTANYQPRFKESWLT